MTVRDWQVPCAGQRDVCIMLVLKVRKYICVPYMDNPVSCV
jgi:hypothetical protein